MSHLCTSQNAPRRSISRTAGSGAVPSRELPVRRARCAFPGWRLRAPPDTDRPDGDTHRARCSPSRGRAPLPIPSWWVVGGCPTSSRAAPSDRRGGRNGGVFKTGCVVGPVGWSNRRHSIRLPSIQPLAILPPAVQPPGTLATTGSNIAAELPDPLAVLGAIEPRHSPLGRFRVASRPSLRPPRATWPARFVDRVVPGHVCWFSPNASPAINFISRY